MAYTYLALLRNNGMTRVEELEYEKRMLSLTRRVIVN